MIVTFPCDGNTVWLAIADIVHAWRAGGFWGDCPDLVSHETLYLLTYGSIK